MVKLYLNPRLGWSIVDSAMPRIDLSTRTLLVNVREVVQFVLARMSVVEDEKTSVSIQALEEGRAWHERIQARYEEDVKHRLDEFFTSETFLSDQIHLSDGWKVIVRGRADILVFNSTKGEYSVVEVKTTRQRTSEIQQRPSWDLQLNFYLWLLNNQTSKQLAKLAEELGLSSVPQPTENNSKGFVHAVNVFTQEEKVYQVSSSGSEVKNELYSGLRNALEYYRPRVDHVEWLRTLQGIPWFFQEYRSGQQTNLSKLHQSFADTPISLVMGPPGAGKTALALRVMLERAIRFDSQVFFSSAKNTQQLEVLGLVRQINYVLSRPLWVIVLTAKERYCIREDECELWTCPFFLAMREKPTSYAEVFLRQPICSVEVLRKMAIAEERFCPYYQAKLMAGFADVVIGDQNYKLDPEVRLGILKRQNHPLLFSKRGRPFLYIIDEAHNLGSRLRENLSYRLPLTLFDDLLLLVAKLNLPQQDRMSLGRTLIHSKNQLNSLPTYNPPKTGATLSTAYELFQNGISSEFGQELELERLWYLRYVSEDGSFITVRNSPEISQKLEQLTLRHLKTFFDLTEHFSEEPDFSFAQKWSEIINTLVNITNASKRGGLPPEYQLFYHHSEEGNILEAFCLDVAAHLREAFLQSLGTILMSASLYPEQFYRKLFGFGTEEASYVELSNDFPIQNRLTLVVQDFNTRYQERTGLLPRLSQSLFDIYQAHPGRYLVFMPNLELVHTLVGLMGHPSIKVLGQDHFTSNFHEHGFIICALGSIFSEGVNIAGLAGVVVVSPGIPPPSYRQSLLQEFYKIKFGKQGSNEQSYNLTFALPGLTKVFQAAGRLHRGPDDRGIVFLYGERFWSPPYRDFLPPFLKPIKLVVSSDIREEVLQFWANQS